MSDRRNDDPSNPAWAAVSPINPAYRLGFRLAILRESLYADALAAREATTSADVTRAADDDADHKRSDFTGAHLDRLAALARRHGLYADPVPCGCCGPQRCCCPCHQEES